MPSTLLPARLRKAFWFAIQFRSRPFFLLSLIPVLATAAWAQGNGPLEEAVDTLVRAVTGPIARGLSLVAIVCGGLQLAYGGHDSKRTAAGLLFGVGMAVGAANFLIWLFPSQ